MVYGRRNGCEEERWVWYVGEMGVVWGGERCVGRRDGCGVWEEKWVWGGEMGVVCRRRNGCDMGRRYVCVGGGEMGVV